MLSIHANTSKRSLYYCVVVIVVVVWLSPLILAHVYTKKGAHGLHQSLLLEGRTLEDDPWSVSAPLKTTDARAKAREGMLALQQAVDIKRDYAQAYRWLGRVALLLDAPIQAKDAFSRYLYLKPDNLLGYWELGLAYERLARHVADATYWHLDLGIEDTSRALILSSVTEPLTTSLGSSYVETPDVAIETPYCEERGGPVSCFVGRDLWAMPLAVSGTVQFLTVPVQSEVLFMHPPSQATWEVALPVTPTAVTFWMGLAPQAEGWWGDGVTFRVLVDDTEVFAHYLTAEQAQVGWQPGSVDLSIWAGQKVRLALATDAGPTGDGAGDWAGWGDVRVVAKDAEVVPWAWVRAAWEKAGITAQDLIAAGESARRAGRYEEALGWYERAIVLAPDVGDSWYYLGLAYEDLLNWNEAANTYQRATEVGYFRYISPSMPYYRIGRVYQLEMTPRRLNAAVYAYEKAIALGQFDTYREFADSHFRLGQTLYWQRNQLDQSLVHLEKAILLDPSHAKAHMLLGRVYYDQELGIELAEAELLESLRLAPHSKWSYYHLAVIYEQEGLLERAVVACQKALELDPQLREAQELWKKLHSAER